MQTMKPFIKTLKLGVLGCIKQFGYSIHRLPPKPKKNSKVTGVILGGKVIKIHTGNPLCFQYKHNPQHNCSIGIAAALVKNRFPTAWAVDVGANIGDTLAIIKGKASLPVICVEGDAFCYDLLRENARLFDDVYLFKTFLSDKPGEANMALQKDGWNLTLTPARPDSLGEKLQFETLDRLVEGIKQPVRVKLLKVDTEGYDMRILKGAAGILERDKPVITFELNRENIEPLGDSVGDFYDYLVNLGYHHFILNDSGGRLICVLDNHTKSQLLDLYQYSYLGQPIYYFDIWAFHETDKDLFDSFLMTERARRI
jgi:FkbM family methyltransferase